MVRRSALYDFNFESNKALTLRMDVPVLQKCEGSPSPKLLHLALRLSYILIRLELTVLCLEGDSMSEMEPYEVLRVPEFLDRLQWGRRPQVGCASVRTKSNGQCPAQGGASCLKHADRDIYSTRF
jgi:hypothetical protein